MIKLIAKLGAYVNRRSEKHKKLFSKQKAKSKSKYNV